MESFHWLLSYVDKEPLTDEELMTEKMNAAAAAAAADKLIEHRAKLAIRKEKTDKLIGYLTKVSWLILFMLAVKIPEAAIFFIFLAFFISKYPKHPSVWIVFVITLFVSANFMKDQQLDNEASIAQKTTSLKVNTATKLDVKKSITETSESRRSKQQTESKKY